MTTEIAIEKLKEAANLLQFEDDGIVEQIKIIIVKLEECPRCHGTGVFRSPVLSSVYNGEKCARRCEMCNGTGKRY